MKGETRKTLKQSREKKLILRNNEKNTDFINLPDGNYSYFHCTKCNMEF